MDSGDRSGAGPFPRGQGLHQGDNPGDPRGRKPRTSQGQVQGDRRRRDCRGHRPGRAQLVQQGLDFDADPAKVAESPVTRVIDSCCNIFPEELASAGLPTPQHLPHIPELIQELVCFPTDVV